MILGCMWLLSLLVQGQSECITGLVDSNTLAQWNQYDRGEQPINLAPQFRRQFIFPGIRFRCTGRITKWIIGAEFDADDVNECPVLGTYRENDPNQYNRQTFRDFNRSEASASRIYEFIPDSPQEFQYGDILGIYQPGDGSGRIRLLYGDVGDTNGPMNYNCQSEEGSITFTTTGGDVSSGSNHLPLVAVEIESDDPDSASCTSDFISQDLLALLAPGLSDRQDGDDGDDDGRQFVFPSYNFTCDGFITSWSLGAAQWRGGRGERNFPQLQIWRRSEASDDTYDRMNSTELTATEQPRNQLTVFSGVIDPPLQFQSGDVLGMYLPREEGGNGRLRVFFGQDSGPTYHFRNIAGDSRAQLDTIILSQNSQEIDNDRPFLALEISVVPPPTTMTSPSTTNQVPMVTTSTAAPNTTSNPSGSDSLAIGIGIAVALVFAALLLAAIVIIIVLCLRKRKAMKKQNHTQQPAQNETALDNAIYGIEENHDAKMPVVESAITGAVYEEPTTGVVATDPAQAERDFDNPLYDDPIEAAVTNTDQYAEPGMEWGIYVPTEEQRRESVYEEPSAAMYAELTQPGAYSKLHFFEERDVYWAPSSQPAELYSQLAQHKYREIFRNQIRLKDQLGSGQFGTVHKGEWSPKGGVEVAVKTLKPGSDQNLKVKFLQEAAINGQFQHPNVVKLHGVVTVGEPIMIVLEYLSNGDLRKYLNKLPRPSPGDITSSTLGKLCVQFCRQIASGMDYLCKKGFVHRDLAARNILVAANKICKIADFGLTRDVDENEYYVSHGGQIPVKWTAPEALKFKKYSTASDVWSFGALMYEIWSLGHKPFEGYTNIEAVRMVGDGYRLPPPPGCPKKLYKLMIQCWHPTTAGRPLFEQLWLSLSQPDTALLSWSEEDIAVHPQAAMLGAPLEAGKHLFEELQYTYRPA